MFYDFLNFKRIYYWMRKILTEICEYSRPEKTGVVLHETTPDKYTKNRIHCLLQYITVKEI